MKSVYANAIDVMQGPAPHGAGGLKSNGTVGFLKSKRSRPAWGGWIEIFSGGPEPASGTSRPARGGWIEI